MTTMTRLLGVAMLLCVVPPTHAQITCPPLITLSGNSGNDVLVGTEQGDRITGNGGEDVIRGRGGSDCLFSGSLDDRLFGGSENDRLQAEGGNDLVDGGDGDDELNGGSGQDTLIGGLGTDKILGEGDDDVFFIRAGDVPAGETEVLNGGSGSDLVVFNFDPGELPPRNFGVTDPQTGGHYQVIDVERVEIAICGNSVRERGETCDDGNRADDDGCDSNCTPTGCGNGVVTEGETCDDGNTDRGDGCSPTCELECGNGVRDGGEQCDDGNTIPGDGCEADCRLPRPVTCGNGVINDGETCDDGNSTSGDGCSSRCQLECGDRIRQGTEQCDDGNRVSGDGCSATCQRECLDPSICSDGDACTADTCAGNVCLNEPLAGRPGILCAIQDLIDNPPCEGELIRPKLRLKLRHLLRLLHRTDDVANPLPIARRAERLRTTMEAQTDRMEKRDKLSPSCAADFARWLIELAALLDELRGS